jgi:hypothetical protein
MIHKLIMMAMYVRMKFAFYHLKSARPKLKMRASVVSPPSGSTMIS